MEKLEVFGAKKLKGQVKISGSKNASLPILASTLLTNKKIYLKNLPNVRDIETMLLLLKSLGANIKYLKRKCINKKRGNISVPSQFYHHYCNDLLLKFN